MAGPAIRCIELATTLSSTFDTTVTAPKVDGSLEVPFALVEPSDAEFRKIAAGSDVVIIQGDALARYPFLKQFKGVVIADLYCPIPLEFHQVSDAMPEDARQAHCLHVAGVAAEQLSYADHFLCASERQRDFWLGALAVAGRINGLRWPRASHANINDLISIVPFGLPDAAPERTTRALRRQFDIPDTDFVAIWGGGVYQWFDPLTIIQAVGRLVDEGEPIHLVFLGVKHPNPGIQEHDMCGAALALAERLGLRDRYVHFNLGWTDYEQRQNYFLDADVGVSAHFDNPETRFAFRTRMLDYLWCGLPIITTRGDTFGDVVANEQLGESVDYEDVDGWVSALKRMKRDSQWRAECGQRSQLCAKSYRWSAVTAQLIDLIRRVEPARDRVLGKTRPPGRYGDKNIVQRIYYRYRSDGMKQVVRLAFRRVARVFGG
ncbi:glycosyltransferase family 4 protein [Methylogaea oryzae]|uniref:Glycosyltransferase n=1 Tax=Methylogaea oryzae TaxID=1295382 RepID=A0A8D5AJD0_9GAMM|nr:glycosyltransferase family 4 protein [Methylogaea oryzae]BBL69931.1 hypothetical protein MoryE10_05370 [Methylogaea oryzae]